MAVSAFEDFLTCAVCFEMFQEPVSLGCNHSFCRHCLQNFWQQNPRRTCPICRRRSSKEMLTVNFALKELSVSLTQKADGEEAVQWERHPEEIRLFCLDKGRFLCPVCEFSRHSRHTVVELDKAAAEVKEQIRRRLKTSRQERDIAAKAEKSYVELKRHSLEQVEECERRIHAEFSRFHQLLKTEEEKSMEELREEQRRQEQAIQEEMDHVQRRLVELNQNISNMDDQIASIDRNVQARHGKLAKTWLDFLKDYGKSKSQVQAQESNPVLPKLGSGLLINQAKIVGNLGFKIWKKLQTLAEYRPVILDPNTASPSLRLSHDLTKVAFAEGQRNVLPDNPERFTNEEIVLGADGFDGGAHGWEVEVGDYPRWDIGGVRASVDRRGKVFSDGEYGIWCLWCGDRVYNDGDSERVVAVTKRPERIRIALDFDRGFLTFYDAHDSTHLCMHHHRFTEKLFPYVSIGAEAEATTKEVKICVKPLP